MLCHPNKTTLSLEKNMHFTTLPNPCIQAIFQLIKYVDFIQRVIGHIWLP